MPDITVEIEVPEVVARHVAALEAKLSDALGIANNNECDALFWRERCEAAERQRDELMERLAAAETDDAEKRRVA